MISKVKVSPPLTQTIPRLELNAALLCTKLRHILRPEFDCTDNKVFYYSDSQIVLYWLTKDPNSLATYQGNRVRKIKETPGNWRYVSTTDNPADMLSRGCPVRHIMTLKWLHGPTWLSKDHVHWPSQPRICPPLDEQDAVVSFLMLAEVMPTGLIDRLLQILDRFEWLEQSLRSVCYMLRWRHNSAFRNSNLPIQLEELDMAMDVFIKMVQLHTFGKSLDVQSSTSKFPGLKLLSPFVKDGFLVVGGRLNQSYGLYQIILPSNSIFTRKLVLMYHRRHQHCGSEWLHSFLRERYWILQGRKVIQQTIKNCPLCIRFRSCKPIQPIMAPLPECRLEDSYAYYHTGVDMAGPFFVKHSNAGPFDRDPTQKIWLVLFTCMTTRGIHLELVESLHVDQFMMALRRMIARKGAPKVLWSDNAKTFKRAEKELKSLLLFQTVDMTAQLDTLKIKWQFIPAYAPHYGGAWERMVRTVKEPLRVILGKATLTMWELYTALTDIEAMVNNRPLTLSSSDAEDWSPVTPAKLLLARPINSLGSKYEKDHELTFPKNFEEQWKVREYHLQHFWNRWRKEYANNLQQRSKWHKSTAETLKIDQVVVIADENKKRNQWVLARIIDIKIGRDGLVRTVKVRTSNGGVSNRTIRALCPLEYDVPDEVSGT